MEDEIDLRKYVDVLIRRWKLIVIITGAAVITAGLISFLSPPVYQATSSVLITRARAEIVLVPEYLTPIQQDSTSMRQALLALVKSPSVANQVIEKIGDDLESYKITSSKLMSKINVESDGDLIRISAKANNQQNAVVLANTWATCYRSYVNDLYSSKIEPPEGLQAQAGIAEKEYKEKQKALEDFIKDNRIDELCQQINDKEILYDAWLLREHIKSGSSSAASSTANSLALVLLQTKAFTSLPSGLQISLTSPSGSDTTLSAVDALITTLETRTGGKPGQSLAELNQDIRSLRAELEQEKARQRELEGARDIAWTAYNTISAKIVETEVAVQAQDGVVRIARFADVPTAPAGSRKGLNICIALILGAIIGIFSAFGLEYFSKPRKRPARSKTKS